MVCRRLSISNTTLGPLNEELIRHLPLVWPITVATTYCPLTGPISRHSTDNWLPRTIQWMPNRVLWLSIGSQMRILLLATMFGTPTTHLRHSGTRMQPVKAMFESPDWFSSVRPWLRIGFTSVRQLTLPATCVMTWPIIWSRAIRLPSSLNLRFPVQVHRIQWVILLHLHWFQLVRFQ